MPSMLTVPFSVNEHLGSNLHCCRSHSDDRASLVQELSGEEAHVFATSHNAPSPE